MNSVAESPVTSADMTSRATASEVSLFRLRVPRNCTGLTSWKRAEGL